jgi:phenylacetate-coenzyme A ligase PaaK-like adenylate-forming protein
MLARFLREDVAPFSPYYGALFEERGIDVGEIDTLEDLAMIPFTTKQDLVEALDEDPLSFVLKPTLEGIRSEWPLARSLPLALRKALKGEADVKRVLEKEYLPIFMTATTGRAARPISFLYSKFDMWRLAVAGRRNADVIGFTSADRGLNLFPYAPHLAFWQVAFAGFEARVFMLSTGGGKTIGTLGNLRACAKMRPTAILGVPSYVYHLLRCAEEEKIRLDALERIVLGAEKVADGLKEKLVEICCRLGAKGPTVTGTYGFTEAKMAWSECPGGAGYHLYPDMGIIEIIDPETGKVQPEGTGGEIVYTALNARGTVVLRYRTGDVSEGGITTEPCPHCGRTVPRLSSRITRLSNHTGFQLTKVKGTLVDLNHISALLTDMREIEEWQIEIAKENDDPAEVDIMRLHVAAAPGATLDAKRISAAVFDATEVAVNEVRVHDLPEMINRLGLETEMKEKRIVDRRK